MTKKSTVILVLVVMIGMACLGIAGNHIYNEYAAKTKKGSVEAPAETTPAASMTPAPATPAPATPTPAPATPTPAPATPTPTPAEPTKVEEPVESKETVPVAMAGDSVEDLVKEPDLPAESVEKPEEAPAESVEKPEETPAESVEKPEEIPAESVEKPEEIPAESVEKLEETPAESVEKPEETPAESVEEPEEIPAESVEKPEETPAESVEKPEEVPAESVEEPEEVPAESVEEPEEVPAESVEEPEEVPAESVEETVEAAGAPEESAEAPLFAVMALRDGTVAIAGYLGTDPVVVIPDEIDGLPVTQIASRAFLGNEDITSVTIPDGVTRVGPYAFDGCTGLVNVTSPSYSVGRGIHLPYQLDVIAMYAFRNCTGITGTVAIPRSVTEIQTGAFMGCTGIGYLTVGGGVNKIGRSAFEGCTRLGVASFQCTSGKVIDLKKDVFKDCPNLSVRNSFNNQRITNYCRKNGIYVMQENKAAPVTPETPENPENPDTPPTEPEQPSEGGQDVP